VNGQRFFGVRQHHLGRRELSGEPTLDFHSLIEAQLVGPQQSGTYYQRDGRY
jgi:hypothetical protein